MRALLIEPHHAEQRYGVREVDIPCQPGSEEPDYLYMGKLLGDGFPERIRPAAEALAGHGVYCDDGFRSKDHEGYIHLKAVYPLPLAGSLLVVGERSDPFEGLTICAASVSLLTIAEMVRDTYIDRAAAKELYDEADRAMERDHPEVVTLRGAYPR